VIGTGLYMEDVNVEIGLIAKQLNAISSAILLLISFLAFYIIRHTVLADRVRRIIWEERERLLQALEESNARFRSLVETTSDWIWEVNPDGAYIYSSPKVQDLLGFAPGGDPRQAPGGPDRDQGAGTHRAHLPAAAQVPQAVQRLREQLSGQGRPHGGDREERGAGVR
jgi:hypothetical protein